MKQLAYYHCEECDSTWQTAWGQKRISEMHDACPKCLDETEIVIAEPHFVNFLEVAKNVKE